MSGRLERLRIDPFYREAVLDDLDQMREALREADLWVAAALRLYPDLAQALALPPRLASGPAERRDDG